MEESIHNQPKKQKIIAPSLRKVFLHNMNTRFGHLLINELRTDLNPEKFQTKIEFTGTRKDCIMKLPHLFAPQEVKIDSNNHYDDKIFENDIFIFNLQGTNYKQVEYIIKGLKTLSHSTNKTLILISSIMNWARTPPQLKEENENDDATEEKNEPEAAENIESEDEEFIEHEEKNEESNSNANIKHDDGIEENTKPKAKILYFKDKDYVLRVPSEKYYDFKMLETLGMSAANINPKLTTYVICPGFIYGHGEDVFYEFFKNAWLQDPLYLPVLGEGKNSIPTIHIYDLVSLVKRIIENNPKQRYIFAVDRTKNKSLRGIVESISKSTGTGRIQKFTEDDFRKLENYSSLLEEFSIDIKCKTSKVFEDLKIEGQDEEDEEIQNALKFKWHCEFGIEENLEKLRKEFTSYRNLNPVKILITGPPASGKTYLSEKLSKYYNLQVYNINSLIEMGKNLPESDPLGEEIKVKIEELREKMIEEFEQSNNKNLQDASNTQSIDRNSLNPRLPDELVAKVLKKFLSLNLCKNRGYILDGYPRYYKDSNLVFYDIDPEKAEDDPNRFILSNEIFPNSVIKLNCKSDEFLKNRIKNNSELADSSQHYTNEAMTRRINLYRELNESDKGELSLFDFFKENKIDILELECVEDGQSIDDFVEKSKIFIERNGKINNYQIHDKIEADLKKENWGERILKEKTFDSEEIKE